MSWRQPSSVTKPSGAWKTRLSGETFDCTLASFVNLFRKWQYRNTWVNHILSREAARTAKDVPTLSSGSLITQKNSSTSWKCRTCRFMRIRNMNACRQVTKDQYSLISTTRNSTESESMIAGKSGVTGKTMRHTKIDSALHLLLHQWMKNPRKRRLRRR